MGYSNYFQKLFKVSTNEVRGYYVLFIIVLVSLAAPIILNKVINTNSIEDEKDLAILDSLVKVLKEDIETQKGSPIDPNHASFSSLVAIGMPKDIAHRTINYREKGGHFEYKEDLKKIYGLNKDMYEDLKSAIALPTISTDKEKTQKSYLSINKARTIDIKNIAGLNMTLSGRVIRYRDILGGYISENQFNEVYGLTEEEVNKLKKYFFISRKFIPQKINVNTCNPEDLSRHPYISNDLAKAIVRYREINGSLKGFEELSAFSLVNAQQRKKLFPYLEF